MNKLIKLLLVAVSLTLIFLIVTNPTEDKFLTRLGTDYGDIHHGTNVSNEILLHLGKSSRTSYILFSKYHYEFGNASADYFGIATLIFFKKSTYEPIAKEEKYISI